MNRSEQKHTVFMQMARDLATLGTCSRRKVGCVIVNKHGVIIGSGFNGGMSGQPHCVENNPDGSSDKCFCLHAEVNAVMNSEAHHAFREGTEYTAYVTTFPCDSCMKLLVAFGVDTVVYDTEYRYFDSSMRIARYYGVAVIKSETV